MFRSGDSGKTNPATDTIYDFHPPSGDRISLEAFDADVREAGIQDFDFIGQQAFHRDAGEPRFARTRGDTWIQGDVNGDGKADFQIRLDDPVSLRIDDFVL